MSSAPAPQPSPSRGAASRGQAPPTWYGQRAAAAVAGHTVTTLTHHTLTPWSHPCTPMHTGVDWPLEPRRAECQRGRARHVAERQRVWLPGHRLWQRQVSVCVHSVQQLCATAFLHAHSERVPGINLGSGASADELGACLFTACNIAARVHDEHICHTAPCHTASCMSHAQLQPSQVQLYQHCTHLRIRMLYSCMPLTQASAHLLIQHSHLSA